MIFISRFHWIRERKEYLEKMNNLPKRHGAGPPEARGSMQLHRFKTDPGYRWLDVCVLNQRTTFLSSQASNLLSFVAKEPHCLERAVPWSLDICSTQRSPVHRVGMHGISNRDAHLYPPHNKSLVKLTISTEVQRSGRITNGMRGGWTTPHDSVLSSPTPAPTLLVWPSQEQRGSGLTASAPVSDVCAPACTNGVWPLLRPVNVAQKNKPSIILSSNVQSINFPMDCTGWPFWTMRQSNSCSTPAPQSSVAKQWLKPRRRFRLGRTQLESHLRAFWRSCWEDARMASSIISSAEIKRLTLQFATVTTSSTRLRLFIQFLVQEK